MIRVRDGTHLELLGLLKQTFPYDQIRLDMFGSARNGFGYSFSDLDFCLRFEEEQLAQVRACVGLSVCLSGFVGKWGLF